MRTKRLRYQAARAFASNNMIRKRLAFKILKQELAIDRFITGNAYKIIAGLQFDALR